MKNLPIALLVFLQLAILPNLFSQNVAINATGNMPDTSAMLDVSSNTKGFLMPRLTTAEQNAIVIPATGLTIFNTTLNTIMLNTGTPASPVWTAMATGSSIDTSSIANFYLKVRGLLSGGAGITYNNTSGLISNSGVRSINGNTGSITMDTTYTANFHTKVRSLFAATAPLTYSNGLFGITQATGSTNGYLSSTDWNTFNNKTDASNVWSILGNSGTTSGTNFIGTTDNVSLKFRTNNTQGLLLDSTGNVAIGTSPSFATSNPEKLLVDAGSSTYNVISGKGNLNSYLQLNIQNTNSGTSASSDVVATNDAGTEANGINFVDMGVNSSGNTSTGMLGGANTGYLYSTGSDFSIGNATSSKNLLLFTGGTASSNERMRIDGSGNVGIGTTSPAGLLHVNGTNPLTLTGVQLGTATSADSILSITSGVVKKLPIATFATPSNSWNTTGNSGTSYLTNFIGTTDNVSMRFRTNNIQNMILDSTGNVAIGSTATFATSNPEKLLVDAGSSSYNVISGKGNLNSYLQLNIKNTNAGTSASSDVVATNDAGTEANGLNFVDMGVNSSGNTSTGVLGGANTGYLYSTGSDFSIGNATASKSLLLFTGGTASANERMRIDGSGNVGIGTSSPSNKLHVLGTNPLFLSGVQVGTATSSDSILSITSGVVKKLPISTFATPANSWNTTGNSGTSYLTNFIGNIDNVSLRFRTNNVQRMKIDSTTGNVAIGQDTFDTVNPERLVVNAGITNSVNAFLAKGSINSYFQINVKNLSNGTNATTDIVATADNGNETSNYVDLGINGSNYSGSAIQTGVANDGYLISSGNDFYLVNSSANKSMLFLTGGTGVANERMRILSNGRVGMGVQDPTAPFVVKDTMEVRRVGSLSQLLFTNTAGTGDFRIGGDGGDLFWQGGGGRNLQMGSYWTTILTGDRQTSTYPSFISAQGGTGVLVLGQRDASVPFAVQANSATQTANLTEWRSSSGSVLGTVTKNGYFGLGTSNPSSQLHVNGTNPLTLTGVQVGTATSSDSILSITSGVVKKLPISTFATTANIWNTTGNSGTSHLTNFIGTTDNISMRFRTNNTQNMILDSIGNVAIGNGATFATSNPERLLVDAGTSSYNVISGKGNLNSYLQLNIKNTNAGTAASSDVVATNDAGTEANGLNFVDMGVNSSGNTSTGVLGGANTGYLYSTGSDFSIGNATAAKNLILFTGGTASTNERMRIDGTGKVGIGTTSPSTALHVNSTNPLTLTGVQLGTSTSTDSLLTITSGTVKKLPVSTFVTSSSGWGTTGNSGTVSGTNFIGTTDNKSFKIRTNNTQAVLVDSLGYVGIGSSPSFDVTNRDKLLVDAGSATSNVITGKGDVNSYLQLNVQNTNNGNFASSDIVATANNGSSSTVYIDMGINSQGYISGNSSILNGSNSAYLYATGSDFYIGNGASGKDLIFFTNSGSTGADGTERFRINSSALQPGSNNNYSLGTASLKWTAVYATNGTIQTSDRRLKTNIKGLTYGLKEVMALQPVRYNWKTNPDADNKIGLIAQDVKTIIPEVVVGDETKENIGMNYAELVPVLINAIKEQQAQIDELKKDIELLKKNK